MTRDFGDYRAVDGLTFSVSRGGIYGFPGPNGAGKTTIRMLIGRLRPTFGTAEVAGCEHDLAYSLDAPSTLSLIPVASDEELSSALLNNAGTVVGLKLVADDDRQSLTITVAYAHWANRDEVDNILGIMEPFLLSELGDMTMVRWFQR